MRIISFLKLNTKIYSYLKKDLRNKIYLLLIGLSLASIFELIALFSILPFLNLISSDQKTYSESLITRLFSIIINSNILNFSPIAIAALIAIFVSLLATIIRTIVVIYREKIIASISNNLSYKAYSNIIYKDYAWHKLQDSNDLIVKLDGIDSIISNIITPSFQLYISSNLIIVLIIGMLIYNPGVTFVTFFIVSLVYLSFIYWCKKKLEINSIGRVKARKDLLRLKADSLRTIREILINNEQILFKSMYKKVDYKLRLFQAEIGYLSNIPRFIIETIGILSLVSIGTFLFSTIKSPEYALSGVIFFGISFQKLIPHIQSMYSSLTAIKSNKRFLIEFIDLLSMRPEIPRENQFINNFIEKEKECISLVLNNLVYYLPNSDNPIIKDINYTFQSGKIYSISGESGSGKSTLLDILMGLLSPTSGSIEIHNWKKSTESKINDLKNLCVHVPQDIFIFNESLKMNIVGRINNKINKDYLQKSIFIANLENIVNSLEFGLDTNLGERGLILSGGQRQRVSLARSIYRSLIKSLPIIFLDEAFNGIDSKTQSIILTRIKQLLSREKIIISVTHDSNSLYLYDENINLKDLFSKVTNKK